MVLGVRRALGVGLEDRDLALDDGAGVLLAADGGRVEAPLQEHLWTEVRNNPKNGSDKERKIRRKTDCLGEYCIQNLRICRRFGGPF